MSASYFYQIHSSSLGRPHPAHQENNTNHSTWYTFQRREPDLTPDLGLPASLTTIESGAFAGISDLVIGVSDTVTEIADNAFDTSVTLYCAVNSAVEAYCKARGMDYIVK